MKYQIKITETNEKTVSVEAGSSVDAINKVSDRYYLAQDNEYILTDNNHKNTNFEAVVPEYDIGVKDKIAATIVFEQILEAMSCSLCTNCRKSKNDEKWWFGVENNIDETNDSFAFTSKYNTLLDVLEGVDLCVIKLFVDSFYARVIEDEEILNPYDWDRKRVILLEESDFFREVLKSVDAEWYDASTSYIAQETSKHKNDDKLACYLVDKSIAYKIIGSQEEYQMIEHDGLILLAYGYEYKSKKEFVEAAREINVDNYMSICNSIHSSYPEIIFSQKKQVLDDIEDLGMQDMYLSAIELDYLDISYPKRYEISETSDAYNYAYAIYDNKYENYAVDDAGDYYLSDDKTFLEPTLEKLNMEGWY